MIKLETEIALPASPEQVWQILTDFQSFPEWNSLEVLEGIPELDSKLTIKTLAPDGSGIIYSFKAVIVNFEPYSHLAWKGGVPGLLSGIHFWQLSPTAAGTHLVHGEDFFGLYVWLKGRKHIMSFEPSYKAMNLALLNRVLERKE